MKILVIRFSSIGDIILTTPIVRCLSKQLNAEVHVLTKESFRVLWESNPYVSRLHCFSENIKEVLSTLKEEEFDHVVDLHNNLRSLQVKKALNIPAYSFPKHNIEKWILVNLKLNILPDIHIVDRYFKTVEKLGVVDDGEGLDVFFPDGFSVEEKLPASHENGFIAWVIGGQHDGKMLSKEKILRLLNQINYPVVLFGGPEDAEKGDFIAKNSGSHVINRAGSWPLLASFYWLKKSKLVVTHDTGLMHVAAAFQKDIISLWGGTVPELGMYPFRPGKNSIILEQKHFMRPSSKLGTRKGIYRLWNFMDSIPDSVILQEIRQRITA